MVCAPNGTMPVFAGLSRENRGISALFSSLCPVSPPTPMTDFPLTLFPFRYIIFNIGENCLSLISVTEGVQYETLLPPSPTPVPPAGAGADRLLRWLAFPDLGAGGGRCLRGWGLPRMADGSGLSDPHSGRLVGGLCAPRPSGGSVQICPPRCPWQPPLLCRPHRLRRGAPAGDGRATVGLLRLPVAGRPLAGLPAADPRLTSHPALSPRSDPTAAGRLSHLSVHPETAGLHRWDILPGTGTAHGLLRPLRWVAARGIDALGGRLSPGRLERVLGLERH